MGYFEDHYADVRYPILTNDRPGLRKPQIGSVHAVAAHLTQPTAPGIVVLPTGSGKTAVLMLAAYLARARRAVVLTPSRLVRAQIADDFSALRTLKKAAVFDIAVPTPKVEEVTGRISSRSEWSALKKFDVVVATPNSISPEYENIPKPPGDLFDLILVDEAHHAPARTWAGVLAAFPAAAQLLFTATPFRRDDREIRGQLLYVYSVREAYADGIYSDINFEPVYPQGGESSDVAIARAAERAFREDAAAGLDHRLMIRTDQKTRAKELKEIYEDHTALRIKAISSSHTLSHVKRAIDQLRKGDLDGVVCVDMLGEGFDLPNLKLAAVHSPHKSLEVTLQFIGRFARAGNESLGQARFFAVPAEIAAENDRLYKEGAVWGEMVHNLSQGRIEQEQVVRRSLGSFQPSHVDAAETSDLSLAALRPFFHVKIYRTRVPVDISAQLDLPRGYETVLHRVSDAEATVAVVTREITQPKWTTVEELARVQYDLFVVVYDEPSSLLFINSSIRSITMYEAIAECFTGGDHQILPLSRVNRVLSEVKETEFFNVGMKNSMANSPTESYRIITGPRADEAIQATDGRMFHRGHVFGKGKQDGNAITIGYSSASKVWSNRVAQIPELAAWCRVLAKKIAASGDPDLARSGLDVLSVGEEVSAVPAGTVIAADWDERAYRSSMGLQYPLSDGGDYAGLLVDLKILVDREGATASDIPFRLVGDGFESDGVFHLNRGEFRFELGRECEALRVSRRDEGSTLVDWLRNYPIDFYFADFSRLHGAEYFKRDLLQVAFPRERIKCIDWKGAGVDISREFGPGAGQSIHEYLRGRYGAGDDDVVVYDHRPGEVADFVAIKISGDIAEIRLAHVKGAGGARPGDRVGDVYEVCGQVVRSGHWFFNEIRLREKLMYRTNTGSTFVKGDRSQLLEAFDRISAIQKRYRVILVQPGLSQSKMTEPVQHVLAAADDYAMRANGERIEVWGSA